jgi:hypothetical protein
MYTYIIIALSILYAIGVAAIFRQFAFFYITGSSRKTNLYADILLALTWPVWLPPMMVYELIQQIRGK